MKYNICKLQKDKMFKKKVVTLIIPHNRVLSSFLADLAWLETC